jgi:hypothetical protein
VKRTDKSEIFVLLLFFIVAFLFSAAEGRGEGIDFQGFVKFDKRINVSDGVSNGDTFGKLRLEAKYDLSTDIFSLISAEGRYYDLPMLEDLPFVDTIESDYPLDILLWEAYFEFSQFISENLDLKIGKQRIVWGTADLLNPTDNLNPNDLTDLLDFGAKIPSLALRASYYLGDNTITGVWIPFFEPALFPRGGIASLLGQLPASVDEPARTIENGMFGLKFSGAMFNLDYSLSYFKGFDDIPIPVKVDPLTGLVMGFPEMQVLGLDFAGEFRSVGFWGETALTFPEEIKIGPNVLLSDEPYLKYTIGMDYTFKNGIYLEAQYAHGFFIERGKGNLSHLLLVNIERNFLNDDLTLSLYGGPAVEDLDNLKDSYGTILVPEASYRPYDNLELSMRLYLFDGKSGTLFGNLKNHDQISFEVKRSF